MRQRSRSNRLECLATLYVHKTHNTTTSSVLSAVVGLHSSSCSDRLLVPRRAFPLGFCYDFEIIVAVLLQVFKVF